MSLLFTDVIVFDGSPAAGRTDVAADPLADPVDVLVTGNRIAAVGRGVRTDAPPDARTVAGAGRLLLVPGLVNAHFHSPANHLKGGLPSLPLELFMLFESPADEALRPSPREAYLRTMLGALEMLRGGTTFVADDAFLMPAPTPPVIDAVMSAYADVGIRATVALDQPELAETDKLPFLAESAPPGLREELSRPGPAAAGQLLDAYDHLVGRWHGACGDRLRAAVSVSAPQRVSVGYFRALSELAHEHDLPVYAHMLETRTQRVLGLEHPRFGGRSLVQWTSDQGLLDEHTNVIHAVWVDDADLDLIAAAGAAVLHNPVSNLRLGSGIAPLRAMLDRGIPVGLGVDEAICNDAVDMWSVVRAAALVHNVSGLPSEQWPTAAEVLDCLWRGGAGALWRGNELGTLAPGRMADLAVLDLHSVAFTPLNDIAGQLVYCENGASVVMTVVDGEVVAENGRVTTVDESALLAEARELFARRRPDLVRAREAAVAVLPTYRAMLEKAGATDVGMTRWVGSR